MQPVQGCLCKVILFVGFAWNKNLERLSRIIAFKDISC